MFAHLRDVHPLLYKEAMKAKETSTTATSSTHRDHKQVCLETIPLFEDHSGENLVEAIPDIHAN